LGEKGDLGAKRKQAVLFDRPLDPMEALTDDNRALLTFFASEVARYLEMGVNTRLEGIEYRLQELDARPGSSDEVGAVKEILRLFSRYKLFRILQALSKLASDDSEFTKNGLIRAAHVGQGFRKEGLDRLVEILCSRGLLTQIGKRGRGAVFVVTGPGKRFLQSYVPGSLPFPEGF
jgi:hypothetical protein